MDRTAGRLAKLSVGQPQGSKQNEKNEKNEKSGKKGKKGKIGNKKKGVRQPARAIALSSPQSAHVAASKARWPVPRTTSLSPAGKAPDSSSESSSSGSDFYSDDESEDEIERKPFPFFSLPYELRQKILRLLMGYADTIDLTVNAAWRVRMMPASRQFYGECCQAFYGVNKFRLLPLDGPVFKKRARPLISFFSARNRAHITRMELRLGPHWKDPPPSWRVDDSLGLEDLSSLRQLDVFVQCDPEHPSYEGFRRSKIFYTDYCGDMLAAVLARLSNLKTVFIDSWPAVGRNSPLLRRLAAVVTASGKTVLWSPHLRLNKYTDTPAKTADSVSIYDTVVIRQMIFAES